MISLGEAVTRVFAGVGPLPAEPVALQAAEGRVLAASVVSPVDLPPWANAAMDGYAVRADDIAAATPVTPALLVVRETVAAGGRPTPPIARGEAVRIMTGAPVPDECDTVVRVEDTDAGVERVSVIQARDFRRNVRARGEDLRAGAVAVSAGTTLTPAWIGVLAACGAAVVNVHRRPRVAIVASGDELVDLSGYTEVLEGHRIVSTNSYTLAALARACGAEVTDLGIVRDSLADWSRALTDADRFDLVLTSGGASVGAFDYARDAAAARGFTLDFWRVRVRPASQTAFGRLGETRWLALPGNPVSAMVGFELFALPLIRQWLGFALPFRRAIGVVLAETVHAPGTTAMLYRVLVTRGSSGALEARLTGPQGTGVLTSMGYANALLHVAQGVTTITAGSPALVLPLDDTLALAATPPFNA